MADIQNPKIPRGGPLPSNLKSGFPLTGTQPHRDHQWFAPGLTAFQLNHIRLFLSTEIDRAFMGSEADIKDAIKAEDVDIKGRACVALDK